MSKGRDKTKPEISHQVPQNKPDMMAYRGGSDTLIIDGESDISDEPGWQALTKGKMWEGSDKDIEIDEDFDEGAGSHLKSADIVQCNISNKSNIAVEPWSPSPNYTHEVDIGVDFEDDIVEIISPELESGWFC